MKPSHHISRTQLYLKYAASDTAIGNYDRAASHAATAVGIHWDYLGRPARHPPPPPVVSQRDGKKGLCRPQPGRRIEGSLHPPRPHPGRPDQTPAGDANAAAKAGKAANANAAANAKDANAAHGGAGAAAHREIFRILRRTRMRARRRLKAILKAMSNEPNPMTFDEAIARAADNRNAPIGAYTCICHGRRTTPCPTLSAARRPRPRLTNPALPPQPPPCARPIPPETLPIVPP